MKNAFICILKIANEHNIELIEFSFFFFFSFSCQVSILYLMKQHRPAQHRNMPTIAPIIPPISPYMVLCESPSKKQQSINDFFNGTFQAIWGLFQALMAYSNLTKQLLGYFYWLCDPPLHLKIHHYPISSHQK